jgi:hypothetical protein
MLLESVGALVPEPIGPTDAEDVRNENRAREMARLLAGC